MSEKERTQETTTVTRCNDYPAKVEEFGEADEYSSFA